MAEIMTYSQARDKTIYAEMHRDPTIFHIGRSLNRGRIEEFGWERERFTRCGIAETQLIGAGVGAAFAGTRPIVYASMSDFYIDGWGQVTLQAAKLRFKIGYKADCPVVLWMSVGGGAELTVHHSGYYANHLANVPGLAVAIPATAADAAGLWRTALRTQKDATCMLQDRGAARTKGPVPDGDYMIPFGVADIKREGSDVTIAAVGIWVHMALEAAEDLAKEGIDAEVWDPRTLAPLDRESLIKSVKQTGAMVAVDQAPRSFGGSGEFMATVTEAITPVPAVARCATMDVPTGAAPSLIAPMYTTKAKIIEAVKGVLRRKG